MRLCERLLVVTVLSALAFAGCDNSKGIPAAHPDSGTPGSAIPDSAGPVNPTPDSAGPVDPTPDSAGPDSGGPIRPADAVSVDTGIASGDSSPPMTKDAWGDSPVPPVGTASISVIPPSIDLGVIDVGETSSPVFVTVTNTGTATSGPLRVTVTGVGITASGCDGVVLAPNDTCKISISARSVAVGAFSGTVEVGDGLANTKRIPVMGSSGPGTGPLALVPSPLDLGVVLAGKTVTGTMVLANTSITSITEIVIGVSGAGFLLGPDGTCTDTLAAGQTCNIDVSFTAGRTSGIAKGIVTVSQGGLTKNAALTANVLAPARLVMTPTSASLQTVVGTPSSPVTFYVTNAGDVASAIPTVTIAGTSKNDFSLSSTCTTSLSGGALATCQIAVVYNPKSTPVTNSSATLTVAEGGTGGSSVTAILTGTAVNGSSLVLTGTSLDLGTVVVGNQGTPAVFTLSNSGGSDSGAVKVVSPTPRFVIGTDNCAGKNLAPKQQCTFTVRFTPTTGDVGLFQGQIKATGADVANPGLLGVTGYALPPATLAISPAAFDFGTIPVSQESTALTLTVTNAGGLPTGALEVEKNGAQFTIKGDACTSMSLSAAGQTRCPIVVTFTPAAATEATGSVTVSAPSSASTITATLRGSGG